MMTKLLYNGLLAGGRQVDLSKNILLWLTVTDTLNLSCFRLAIHDAKEALGLRLELSWRAG